MKNTTFESPLLRYDDEQIARIICKIADMVEDDAKPVLVRHLYQLAYDADNLSSVFNAKLIPLIKALSA